MSLFSNGKKLFSLGKIVCGAPNKAFLLNVKHLRLIIVVILALKSELIALREYVFGI